MGAIHADGWRATYRCIYPDRARAKCTPPSAKIAAVSANSDRRWCEVIDLGAIFFGKMRPRQTT
jgi:hypothetical protein